MRLPRRIHLPADRRLTRSKSERGVATVALIIGAIVCVGAAGTIAYVATDGFGGDAEPAAAPPTDETTDTPPTTEPEEAPASSPMDQAFAAGQSVVCTYTHEAHDATTTLRSKDIFRIDQQSQGGLAHVIRHPEHALVWIDGMSEAMQFDTEAYEQSASDRYPTFDPSEFDIDVLFSDGTCAAVSAAEDAAFELPTGMTSAPATP